MENKLHLTQVDIDRAAAALVKQLIPTANRTPLMFGVPRGGIPAMYAVRNHARWFEIANTAGNADLLIDDLLDSGATVSGLRNAYPGIPVGVLYTKRPRYCQENNILYGQAMSEGQWLVFPWEGDAVGSAEDIVTRFLQYIGEDPAREGLRETPKRIIKAWDEWFSGYKKSPSEVLKVFADGGENVDEMVIVRNIPIYSHCEHHGAPFFGEAHIAYIPNGRIVGLSKLARLADVFAKRLQVQERLTNQIADALASELDPKGVGVVIECRHLCMESRGIRKSGASTVTSAMRGAMLDKSAARAELLALVRR